MSCSLSSCALSLLTFCTLTRLATSQCDPQVHTIATNIKVSYTIISNPQAATSVQEFDAEFNLTNTGSTTITLGNWSIYMSSVRLVNSASIDVNGAGLDASPLKLYHINGDLHRLVPTVHFQPFLAGATLRIKYSAEFWVISRTDVMPNWYVVSDHCDTDDAQVIANTADELNLDFVQPFERPEQWKRLVLDDLYDPLTPETRFTADQVTDQGRAPLTILPTPYMMTLDPVLRVNVKTGGWIVVNDNNTISGEAAFLANKLNLPVFTSANATQLRRQIHFIVDHLGTQSPPLDSEEAYVLEINVRGELITIAGPSAVGIFHGIQSLLSLAVPDGVVPGGTVIDGPRFVHRGFHIDVCRNFHSISDLEKLLDVMSQYKLNVLHLHMGDDEGWRLQIPDLPQLTDIGSKRCHNPTEDRCIIPQVGSGPNQGFETSLNAGSGNYSVEEYKGILRYAVARHIRVIPEFDMPGHAHAAIKSMEARYHQNIASNRSLAEEYLLSDLNDTSVYLSVQYFTDNAMNPCINSTYRFIQKVLREVKEMHREIQPLSIYHFGGDETPAGAAERSVLCEPLKQAGKNLKQHFVEELTRIAGEERVNMVLWEDGLYMDPGDGTKVLMNKTQLPNGDSLDIYSNVWDNIWEYSTGGRAYELANGGYKVILNHATHLYFDFPPEPDPEERGYYWASRQVPIKKTFSYTPDSIYANIDLDVSRFGTKLDRAAICENDLCPELEADKRQNIVGMEGNLWSETQRTSEDIEYMIYPRILALAERAWHRAGWEAVVDPVERVHQRDVDWEVFANTFGYKELLRLDHMGINYRVPVAAARVNSANNQLEYTAGLPGLPVQYSLNLSTGNSWTNITGQTTVEPDQTIYLRVGSADGSRFSRVVSIKAPSITSSSSITPLSSMTSWSSIPPSHIPPLISAAPLSASATYISLYTIISVYTIYIHICGQFKIL